MRTHRVNLSYGFTEKILLGRQGENEVVDIVFDFKSWLTEFGEGTIELVHQRDKDPAPYPVVLDVSGTEAIWHVKNYDVAKPGTGKFELRYVVENRVVKSQIYLTSSIKSLVGEGNTPGPLESWLEQVINAREDARGYADSAETSATSASNSAETAEEASKHYPYIRTVDNHWMVWSVAAGEYTDTGVIAKGEKGEPGDTAGTYPPEGGIPASDLSMEVLALIGGGGDGEGGGYSPTVTVTEIEGGHRVTITDADGPHVFDVLDGADGAQGPTGPQGAAGADGEDGVSPTVAVAEIEGGHRVTITDVDGPHVFDVMDGADGAADDNVHYHSTLKNAVDDANSGFANAETATKSTAICKLTKLLNGDFVIDCLTDAAITEVLKPSVTMRINTNGHAITVNNSSGQIMSTVGNTDKIFDFVFDATGSTVTITGGSNANTQVFGWLFGDIESKTLKDSSGNVLWYESISACPSASSNSGKYACLIKRDDADLVEFADIYKSNGTAWEVFSSDSPHGKLSVLGGTYTMNCSGISTYFIRLSFSHAEIVNVDVTVTNTHTESYSGTAPDGILNLVKPVCSTANIKNSTLKSYYTGNIDMHTSGIDIDECSVVSMDKVSMICDAPYHDNSGNSYGTYCCNIGRTCFAYVRNCNLNSMHSAISNNGNCFIDGGTYESISHGGIYVSGRGVIIAQNAHIGAGTYTGLGELQYGMCAFTLGWEPTDKPTCYLHNCTLEAPSAKGFIAFRTAANANLYMSKTNIPANKMIRVDYVNAVGDNFEDMTDAEKPVIHVGNDCNVTLDMLACRTRAGNSKVEPPIKTQFTTTDAGKILFDSINSSSDEESIADADAIKNSLNITKENYAFFFSPYEWEKIVGSLMTFRSYITDISDIRDELNGINTLVGSGVIE